MTPAIGFYRAPVAFSFAYSILLVRLQKGVSVNSTKKVGVFAKMDIRESRMYLTGLRFRIAETQGRSV